MDLGSLVSKAPIGLLVFAGMYAAARRRKSGHARAARELPDVARRLGLEFRARAEPGAIGTLRGTVGGYDVFVDPDERPRVVAYFTRELPLILRTYEHEKRTPNDQVRLDTGSTFTNQLFKDRYGAPALSEPFADRGPLLEASVRKITDGLGSHLAHLSVTRERIECAVDFGRPVHIPPEHVEALVPQVVALGRLLEELSAAAGEQVPRGSASE